jgi:hypothetical protein
MGKDCELHNKVDKVADDLGIGIVANMTTALRCGQ